ncbi:hypothetical protein RCL_jg7217.t1 [Rhizophagus clarus]|uniref:Uncharacterized protein n=1 Tax=Rhizophagus clarus TaxID=94130 RepID=A0A8H3M251_9GLOM|nr:hypothetical protein RCL_jg7217.t1 [Rhizophagus clarus]
MLVSSYYNLAGIRIPLKEQNLKLDEDDFVILREEKIVGFLRHYREVVVASSLAEVGTIVWKSLDITWFRRFSEEATLELLFCFHSDWENYCAVIVGNHPQLFLHGYPNFVVVKSTDSQGGVNKEHSGLENYWKDVEEECKSGRGRLSIIAQKWEYNLDEEDEDYTMEEKEISDIDDETPELTEGVQTAGEEVAYTGFSNHQKNDRKNLMFTTRQSDVDFGHNETVDLGDENVDLGNIEMDSVHSSGASDDVRIPFL